MLVCVYFSSTEYCVGRRTSVNPFLEPTVLLREFDGNWEGENK